MAQITRLWHLGWYRNLPSILLNVFPVLWELGKTSKLQSVNFFWLCFTIYVLIFSFENIRKPLRKPLIVWCFQWDQKETLHRNALMVRGYLKNHVVMTWDIIWKNKPKNLCLFHSSILFPMFWKCHCMELHHAYIKIVWLRRRRAF